MKGNLKIAFNFIREQDFCVLSTIDKNCSTEAATMAFSITPQNEIIFSTSKESKKAENILQNKNVAVTFGWDKNEFIKVQLKGEASFIEKNLEFYKEVHFTKNPSSRKYSADPKNIYLLVKPTYLKYSDLKVGKIFEISRF